MSDFVSVSTLTGYIKNIIYAEDMLHNIKLVGEVSGIRCSGAHAYFTLKDDKSQIMCNLFNYAKTYLPKNGESVCLHGGADFYPPNGKLSFNCNKVEPLGQGLLAFQLEQLRKRLEAAGYFDERHKKPIPKYPSRVCVLTAKTGAVIRDIVTTIRRKNQLLNVDVVDVKVQGQLAEQSIISALSWVDKLGYDAIIIARGGGSMEDLMPFNSERLVYAIFDAKTPIISAVGHQTDFTLCDFAADIRVPTPTAAGELVGYDVSELQGVILAYCEVFRKNLANRLEWGKTKFDASVRAITSKLQMNILTCQNKLSVGIANIGKLFDNKCLASWHNVEKLIERINANNPIKILGQGYSKIYDGKGVAADIDSIAVGDDIVVLTNKGKIEAAVKNIIRIEE